ncbi:MAG: TRC40/GET3/ArsA family transport-energizing ATPase [Thermodesulfobacteriota bacterium]
MRIIFFAGKGGVGKTSASAATGIRSAALGKKTLILSLDVAHSLSDIFDLPKKLLDQNRGEPVKVAENLFIQELDMNAELSREWAQIHDYVTTVLRATGIEEILAEELAVLPGMEELTLLMKINRYVRENEYDVLILDSAPTGEAVRFISIPTALEWYMKKFFNIERTVVKMARPLVQKVYNVPLPDDKYFAAIKDLFERLRGVDQVLTDPEITTVRLVSNPEKIVLKETQRAFMYFTLYRMHIDAIIMNRVLPATLEDDYFSGWKKTQQSYVKLAETYFAPTPLLFADLFPGEVLGLERLRALGDKLYGDRNPLERFIEHKAYELTKKDGRYRLAIRLPFVEKNDVSVARTPDELVIRLGNVRRHVLLPMHVANAAAVKAKFEGDTLCVYFAAGK